MSDDGSFFWGLMFSAIGLGYFMYGKSQQNLVVLGAGILLCAYPYLVSGLWMTLGIGAALVAVPWVLHRE